MKKALPAIFLALLASSAVFIQAQDDQTLMEKAKLAIFDKNWQQAIVFLDEAISKYPSSPFYDAFIFYKGKCLEELQQWKPALAAFDEYIKISKNQSLKEDAQGSRIHISFELYKKGERSYLKNITDLLKNPNKAIRYYAAFELSYGKEKEVITQALPVLVSILRQESDQELKDKAKLAILRIDPARLNALEQTEQAESQQPQVHFLVIEVIAKNTKDSTTIRVPIALADLALKSMTADTKDRLKEKGYDIDQILKQISQKTGTIIEVREGDELVRIRIE